MLGIGTMRGRSHNGPKSNLEILPLERDVVIEAMRLPEMPTRDPADELIVALARLHNLTLMTTDTRLKGYRHARVVYFKPLVDRV